MNRTIKAIQRGKRLRVIGFDDAPFIKIRHSPVNIAGVVCAKTRFEGMLWGEIEMDGLDVTNNLVEMIKTSKFHNQLHAVLLDGITFGGFNIIELPMLVEILEIPCIAVMRKLPDLGSFKSALDKFDDSDERQRLLKEAGPVIEKNGFTFQAMGIDSNHASRLLESVTDTGHVPEALRLAHLIGAAIKTGQSSKRA